MDTPEIKNKTSVCLLTLSKEMVEIIGKGLMELPTKEGMPVILSINQQIELMVKNVPEFVAGVEALLAPLKAKLEVPES